MLIRLALTGSIAHKRLSDYQRRVSLSGIFLIQIVGRCTRTLEPLGKNAKRCYPKPKEHNEMTIQLPNELESSIKAAVNSGRFASVDDAMAEAARLLLREISNKNLSSPPSAATDVDPVLGCMKDDAELMDQIVADAYRQRCEDNGREIDL